MHFQTISDKGQIVDQGTLQRFSDEDKKRLANLTMSAAPPTTRR
jgi:hypothetical protein